jgi:hypothetical protein
LLTGAGFAQDPRPTTEAMREDVTGLTSDSPNAATVRRDPRGSPCTLSKPFEFMACGPVTTISLALMPGMAGSLDQTTTQGGQSAQLMDQLLALGQSMDAGTLEDWAREADSRDGTSVNLVIPLIDYGFSGSFGNAYITMNRANRDTHYSVYESIGPRDAKPGPEKAFPLSGSVTIEEYTPWVLRGSFSAAMVDKARSDMNADDPVLTVVHQLTGTFNVTGPWRGDRRASVAQPDDLERMVRQDVGSVFAVGLGDGARGPGAAPGGGGASGEGSSSGMDTGVLCDCSCNGVDSAPSDCQAACEGTFLACRGEPVAMLTDEYFAQQADLEVTVESYSADLRKRFEAFLRDRYGNQPQVDDIVDGYLDSFDDVADLNARVSLIGSAGMPVDCPPPPEVAERMKMASFIYCQFLPEQQ